MTSGDNRGSVNKLLKGATGAEKPMPSKLPQKKPLKRNYDFFSVTFHIQFSILVAMNIFLVTRTLGILFFFNHHHYFFSTTAQSPIANQRTDSLKRRLAANLNALPVEKPVEHIPTYPFNASIPSQTSISLPNSPKIMANARHAPQHLPAAAAAHIPALTSSPRGSPLRRSSNSNHASPKRQNMGEEQWIDGPRLSKLKVAEARHMMREINHVKKCETWIDGPNLTPSRSLANTCLPASCTQTYGYMDNHKKSMIRQWVENQTCQVFPGSGGQVSGTVSTATSTATQSKSTILPMSQARNVSDDEEICIETTLNEITESLYSGSRTMPAKAEYSIRMQSARSTSELLNVEHTDVASARSAVTSIRQHDSQEDEDQDSGPSEVPPALPLIEPLSSREISHDSIHMMCSRHVSRENVGLNVETIDCGLQVTEEEIARAMGR